MPLDGITLNLLKNELSQYIVGSRIEKIHQPSKDELVFHLRSREGAYRLLVSASANSPRLHLTANAPENPATPPMLCMLFRKHLIGATLVSVEQYGLDRIAFFNFDATNDIGDRVKLTLAVEIMAQHSNVILINEDNRIVDALKRVDAEKSSYRLVLPGAEYKLPPPQEKLDLRECEPSAVCEAVLGLTNAKLSSAILKTIQGVSPLVTR